MRMYRVRLLRYVASESMPLTVDCTQYKNGKALQQIRSNKPSIGAEYTAFMHELIGDGPMSSNRPIAAINAPKRSMNAVKVVNAKMKGTLSNGYHNVPPPNIQSDVHACHKHRRMVKRKGRYE
eukprot:389503_1